MASHDNETSLTDGNHTSTFPGDKSKVLKEKLESRAVKGVKRIGRATVFVLDRFISAKIFKGAKTDYLISRKNKGVKNAKRNGITYI